LAELLGALSVDACPCPANPTGASLFDNTPLSSLLKQISSADAATTRVIVINLFPNEGAISKNRCRSG
jgi:hypothetical protein